jgi:hypothetical protein
MCYVFADAHEVGKFLSCVSKENLWILRCDLFEDDVCFVPFEISEI